MKRADKIPTGSRWIDTRAVSSIFESVRVMGTVEGWVVARFKGCAPFLLRENEWEKRFQRHAPAQPKAGEVA